MVKAIVFDFDGTLASSFSLVEFCFKKIYKEILGKEITVQEIEKYYGPSEKGIIQKMFGKDKSKEIFYQFLRDYNFYHDQFFKDFFPGMRELLNKLKKEGKEVFLLTGRSEETAIISLTKLNAFSYFKDFYWGSTECAIKDQLLKELMDDYGYKNDEIIYIGDSLQDVEQCNDANVKIASVTYNDPSYKDKLEKINPGMVFESVEELKKYLLSL